MNNAAFIAGDWGTSRLRLYLCTASGEVLDEMEGPGAAQAKGNFPAIFTSLVASWRHSRELPALLCGMAGSSIGWQSVAAIHCPASPHVIAQSVVRIAEHNVCIVPGLSCRNVLNAPDFMRGEETQLLGALQLQASLRQGKHLLCLPGTHTKWVMLSEGKVEHFMTAPAGELFALLCRHSVLVSDNPSSTTPSSTMNTAFMQGVDAIINMPHASVLARVFECRSRRLSGELGAADAPSFLSGLLIATDIKDALTLFPAQHDGHVVLIGAAALCELYTGALSAMKRSAITLSGDETVRAGLVRVFQEQCSQEVS
ncbi:MAG: 2-dehydro-3-deoxygalactonokinase [Steroidobacter sp.]